MDRVGPSILANMKREGQPLPPEATPPPFGTHPEIETWIMRAFTRLSSCRAIGMVIAPIPWTAIVAYADRAGLDREAAETFTCYVEALDRAYLADQAQQEAKRHARD